MPKIVSAELKEMIRKFCRTHKKIEAVKRFGVSKQTVIRCTERKWKTNPGRPKKKKEKPIKSNYFFNFKDHPIMKGG